MSRFFLFVVLPFVGGDFHRLDDHALKHLGKHRVAGAAGGVVPIQVGVAAVFLVQLFDSVGDFAHVHGVHAHGVEVLGVLLVLVVNLLVIVPIGAHAAGGVDLLSQFLPAR